MWQGLGGEGCPELFQVEQILWRGMFDVAAGIFPLKTRFRSAFREAGMVDLSRVGYPESEWLSGGASLQIPFATAYCTHPRLHDQMLRFLTILRRRSKELERRRRHLCPPKSHRRTGVLIHRRGTRRLPRATAL